MGEQDRPTRLVHHIHAVVPVDLADRIGHIAIAQRTTRAALVVEALGLLAGYYDIGHGLPAPAPPLNRADEAASRRPSAAQAPNPTTAPAPDTTTSLRDASVVAAAVADVSNLDEYLDPTSVMRDAGMTKGDAK